MPEPTPKPGAEDGVAVFYRYQDSAGDVHLVDQLQSIPPALRAKAEEIRLPRREAEVLEEQYDRLESLASKAEKHLGQLEHRIEGMPGASELHWPSFGLGVLACMGLVIMFRVFRGTARLILKLIAVGVLLAVVGGAYFGWVRRSAGLGEEHLANPSQLIDDAKKAAEEMNTRTKKTKQALEKAVQ